MKDLMLKKIKVSEIFGPAGFWNFNVTDSGFENEFVSRYGVTQGEGKYVGTRSVFVRLFGCNLRCPSFGLEHGDKTEEPMLFARNISQYKNIGETPAAQYGCDSYFSVYPEFKTLSPTLQISEVASMIMKTVGGSFFSRKDSPVHLILTGGEPMLPGWQGALITLVKSIALLDAKWPANAKLPLTIETNGTQPIKDIQGFLQLTDLFDLTWSISPKLKASGHGPEETIFPDVIKEYHSVSDDLYLKFVVQSKNDFDEIDAIVQHLDSIVNKTLKVYIMPEGGTAAEYAKHSTLELASEAVKRGYDITPRLQVLIGGNVTGW